MKENPTIQKLICILLLLIFTLSSTPKVLFHDFIADHTDVPVCELDHNDTAVHEQGFDCHFDDLVVSTTYVLDSESYFAKTELYQELQPQLYFTNYRHCFFQSKESRGPPSV